MALNKCSLLRLIKKQMDYNRPIFGSQINAFKYSVESFVRNESLPYWHTSLAFKRVIRTMRKQWRKAFVTHFFTCILAANWPLFLILPLPTFKAADKSLPLWGGEAQYRNSLGRGCILQPPKMFCKPVLCDCPCRAVTRLWGHKTFGECPGPLCQDIGFDVSLILVFKKIQKCVSSVGSGT